MANLLKDTVTLMDRRGIKPSEVLWVSTSFWKTSWENFEKAADFEYDDEGGGFIIDPSLVIVGSNFRFERKEYDGSEFWVIKPITDPKEVNSITKEDILYKWDR